MLRQIELLEDQGDTLGFAEEMKRIYRASDSVREAGDSLSQSDRLLQAKSKLAQSASKYMKNRASMAPLAQVSEELDEAAEDHLDE